MGVHKTTVSKTIIKLLKRKWIYEIENIPVKGGKVRQFIIVDIWELNIKEYERNQSGHNSTTNRTGALIDGSGAIIDGSGAQSDTKKNYKEEEDNGRKNKFSPTVLDGKRRLYKELGWK